MDGKDRPRRRRRHRRRKSSINTDLLDSDSDGERTKKMDEVELAPESRWRQLRYQTYLRERMRNGIRAQNAVWVDTMGRPVTLAERILRFRVEQQEKEQTEVAHAESQEAQERDKNSVYDITPSEQTHQDEASTRKASSLRHLLAQYTQQREQEAAIGSALLEVISHAKEGIQRDSKLHPRADSWSISLGDSATNVNAKTRHESRRHSHIHHQDAISTTATPNFVGTVTCSNSHDDGEVCKDHETRVQQESKTKSAKNSGKSPRNLSGPMETVQSPDGASKRECSPVRRSVLSAKYSQPEGEASQTSPQVVQRSESLRRTGERKCQKGHVVNNKENSSLNADLRLAKETGLKYENSEEQRADCDEEKIVGCTSLHSSLSLSHEDLVQKSETKLEHNDNNFHRRVQDCKKDNEVQQNKYSDKGHLHENSSKVKEQSAISSARLSSAAGRNVRFDSGKDVSSLTISDSSQPHGENARLSKTSQTLSPDPCPETSSPDARHSVYYFLSHRFKRNYTDPEILKRDSSHCEIKQSRASLSRESRSKVKISSSDGGTVHVEYLPPRDQAGSIVFAPNNGNSKSPYLPLKNNNNSFLPDIKMTNGISNGSGGRSAVEGTDACGYKDRAHGQDTRPKAINEEENTSKTVLGNGSSEGHRDTLGEADITESPSLAHIKMRAIGLHKELSAAGAYCKRPALVSITLLNSHARCDMRIDWGLHIGELDSTADPNALRQGSTIPNMENCGTEPSLKAQSCKALEVPASRVEEKLDPDDFSPVKEPELTVAGSLQHIKGLSYGVDAGVLTKGHARRPAEFLFVREVTLSRYINKERLKDEMRAYLEPVIEKMPHARSPKRLSLQTYRNGKSLIFPRPTEESTIPKLPCLPSAALKGKSPSFCSPMAPPACRFDSVNNNRYAIPKKDGAVDFDCTSGSKDNHVTYGPRQRLTKTRREKALSYLTKRQKLRQNVP